MDSLLHAVGAVNPLQLEINGPNGNSTVPFATSQPFAILGRDECADLVLSHSSVSRRHAYLQVIAGRVLGVDLDSRSGLGWKEGRQRIGWLGVGEVMRIGPFRVKVSGCAGPNSKKVKGEETGHLPAPLVRSELACRDRGSPILEAQDRSGRRVSWPLLSPLVLVGRSPNCTLQLDDLSVSRFHISLLNTPDGVWVIDLLGRNGVRVNGSLVRAARLEQGDDLRIGAFALGLRSEASAVPRARFYLGGPSRAMPALTHTSPAPLPTQVAGSAKNVSRPQVGQFQETRLDRCRTEKGTTDTMVVPKIREAPRQAVVDLTQESKRGSKPVEAKRQSQPETGRHEGLSANGEPQGGMPPPHVETNAKLRGHSQNPSPPPSSSGSPSAAVEVARADTEFHASLCNQMAMLHQVRRSRWRRFLLRLSGK